MAILQLTTEKENTLCFDFLEENIREESKKLIESIYADEVRQFLMRGLENIGIEWDLVTISYNISRMYALKNLSPAKM